MKKINNISEFVKVINKGTFGITLVALTEPKMNKRGNDLYGRVKKLSYTTNVALGYDYASYIVSKLAKEGIIKSVEEVEAEKPKGRNWANYPYILESDKDSSQKYLRCYYRPNTKTKSLYLVDDNLATDEEVEYIKSFLSGSSNKVSNKQAELGLTDENQVIIRDYKLENVIALYQGEKVYNDCLVTTEQIKEFFGNI